MNYKIKVVESISKYRVLKDKNSYNNDKFTSLSHLFWFNILDPDSLRNFIESKYIELKKEQYDNVILFKKEYQFIISRLNTIRKKLNYIDSWKAPLPSDVFFSFRIYSTIIDYYNEYYKDEKIRISLMRGLNFEKSIDGVNSFFENINYYYNTSFVKDIIKPIIINSLWNEKQKVYVFKIFWPDELTTIWIISKIIRDNNPKVKIIIDLSETNEQFDFREWAPLIKNDKRFFDFFDYYIIYNDFKKSMNRIIDYENNKQDIEWAKNIIYRSNNKTYYRELKSDLLNDDMLENFVKDSFNSKKIMKIMGLRNIYNRFSPYKCYWSKCNFCAINSQNKFIYDSKFSHEYFIDKWVKFIKENKIEDFWFMDEAIPPVIILSFAKKIVASWIKFKYQFRTRFDKAYTYENCKILYESWANFCGIWLESAVDRVNKEIANKGTDKISIKEKLKIIYNFDKAWVSIHNYAIMWFPWETEKEIVTTYKFLKENIVKLKNYTCSPNIYSLMKWTKIFSERDKHKVEINKKDLDNPFKLSYKFKVDWKKNNYKLLFKIEEELHRAQFTPWLDSKNYSINASRYWEYLDRSYIFYVMKRSYERNPYYLYKEISDNVLKKNYKDLLDSYFYISKYIQIYELRDRSYIYDWVWCKDITIRKGYINFLKLYNKEIKLKENLDSLWLDYDRAKEFILLLLKERILRFRRNS